MLSGAAFLIDRIQQSLLIPGEPLRVGDKSGVVNVYVRIVEFSGNSYGP